jgi:hypothetical protein
MKAFNKPSVLGNGFTANRATFYYFDAVIRAEHSQDLEITRHPVQDKANISDHAYLLPVHIMLEIGMSDAMDRYAPTDYSSDFSKSVSAYKEFADLQKNRTRVSLTTRLATFDNLLIKSIRPVEDHTTKFALKATILFEQIITGRISTHTVTAKPQVTKKTEKGTQQVTQPKPAITKGRNVSTITSTATNTADSVRPPAYSKVQGAGVWTGFMPTNGKW